MEAPVFDDKAFGQRLKELRIQRGLTQEEASEMFHLSVRQWQRFESGTSRASIDMMISFAETFQVSSDYLFFGERKMKQFPDHIQKKIDEVTRLIQELIEDLKALDE